MKSKDPDIIWGNDGDLEQLKAFFHQAEPMEEQKARIKQRVLDNLAVIEEKGESDPEEISAGLAGDSDHKQNKVEWIKSVRGRRSWKGAVSVAAMVLLILAGHEAVLSFKGTGEQDQTTQTAYTNSSDTESKESGSSRQDTADASAATGGADSAAGSVAVPETGGADQAQAALPEVQKTAPAADGFALNGSTNYTQSVSSVQGSGNSGSSGDKNTAGSGSAADSAAAAGSAESAPAPETPGIADIVPVRVEYVLNMTLIVSDPSAVNSNIADLAVKQGGYVEGNKSLDSLKSVTARIPVENLANFQTGMLSYGKIANSNLDKNNISSQYNGTQAQLNQMGVQRQKYETLLKEAKTEQDILHYKQALADLQNNMEILQKQITDWDYDLQYAPVTIHLLIN